MRHIWHCTYMDDTAFASCTTCGRQYTLQDNVPMYALMHCAKSNGYF